MLIYNRPAATHPANIDRFYHQAYKCCGIKACQHIDQDLIERDDQWNVEFDPRNIGRIRRQYAGHPDTQDIDAKLREATES